MVKVKSSNRFLYGIAIMECNPFPPLLDTQLPSATLYGVHEGEGHPPKRKVLPFTCHQWCQDPWWP